MVRLILLRVLESFFRHRWLYCLPPIIMIAAAVIYLVVKPPVYNVSGRLFVEKDSLLASLTASDQNGTVWSTPAQVTVSEINELIATQAFVRSAIQRSDLETSMSGTPDVVDAAFTEFRKSITVHNLGDKLVEIQVANQNPRLAQQLVVATMDAYVQWKINNDYQESVAAQTFFANLIKPYQEEQQRARDALTSYLESYPDPVRGDRPLEEQTQIQQLQAAVTRAEEKVNTTQKNEEDARLALAKAESVVRQTYVVIDTPAVPQVARVSLQDALKSGLLFIAIGIFLSLVGIVFGAVFDRSLRFTTDVQHVLSLSVLALVPMMRPGSSTPTASDQLQTDARPERGVAPAPDRPELQPRAYAAREKDVSL